jgi:hypothetical protein
MMGDDINKINYFLIQLNSGHYSRRLGLTDQWFCLALLAEILPSQDNPHREEEAEMKVNIL